MIASYKDRRTRSFAEGLRTREFSGFERQGWKRLEVLDAAESLQDLRALPSNRLEALSGDREGQFSIRINLQRRICSDWPAEAAGPSNVEIVDYHLRSVTMARPPIHPGEILADELMEVGVTPSDLARQIKVPANRVSEIIRGRRSITGDTALRLGHWFGSTPQFWLNLQSAYELRHAAEQAGEAIAELPRRRMGAG